MGLPFMALPHNSPLICGIISVHCPCLPASVTLWSNGSPLAVCGSLQPPQYASHYGRKIAETVPRNMWFYLEQVKQCKKIDPSFIAFQGSGESNVKSWKD